MGVRVAVGLDYGRERTGVAVMLAGVVVPQEPILRSTWTGILERLERLREEHGELLAVVGLPLTASGRRTELTGEVEALAAWLGERGVEVHLQDEVGTTAEAALMGGDGRDGRLDSMAAAVILKRYLGMP